MVGTSDIQMLLMHCSVDKQFRRLIVGVDKMVSSSCVPLWLFSPSCLVASLASSLEVHLPANVGPFGRSRPWKEKRPRGKSRAPQSKKYSVDQKN